MLRRQARCLFCLSATPPEAVVHLAETGREEVGDVNKMKTHL